MLSPTGGIWKLEPASPSSVSEDACLYWTTLNEDDLQPDLGDICESRAQIAVSLLENLEQLEDLDEWIKEEPFSNWMEEKMLPIFEVDIPGNPIKTAGAPDTQSLLQEFETVFDSVELNHCALTPPQSPPYEHSLSLAALASVSPQTPEAVAATLHQNRRHDGYLPHQNDVDRELAVVEELVRARVENLIPSSPSTSCSSAEDPDWIPESCADFDSKGARDKPYTRPSDDKKKSRKKEQNKNAATRYRLKKKAEVEEILGEERELQTQNDDLETQIKDVRREIKYIKGLMRELFRAKGLIN